MRLFRLVGGALFMVLLFGAMASACGSGSASPATTEAPSSSTSSPPTTEPAPSLTDLTAMVQSQITGTGPNDFNVGGVNQVTCTPPTVWQNGALFKCIAFDFAKDDIGEYDGTVVADSGGKPQWNGVWSPK